ATRSWRRKISKRGMLNARRTLMSSLRHVGLPVCLHWKTVRRTRPRVFVVCDVSSSVAAAARFLLLFLYAVNEVLPRVRSFAFASRFGEVTDYFSGPSGQAAGAVDRVLAEYAGSGTDYGGMLSQVWVDCGGVLDKQSTVIVL